jgi:hypothetical protein
LTRRMPDAEAVMSLRYEGPAVDAGTMDVRSLAPALIAAADAVREAHALLEVRGPTPRVEVRATRPGSFVVDLLLAELPTISQRAIAIFTASPIAAIDNFAALAIVIVNASGWVKRLGNRKIRNVSQPEPGVTRIVLEDGTVIDVPSASFALISDGEFRRALNGMVEPLANDSGVQSLSLSAGDQAETVTVDDLGAFKVPPGREEDLGHSEAVVVLRPVSIVFAERNKWRFSDGDAVFFASIEDPRFLADIDLGTERFAKNDMLQVRLRTTQKRDSAGVLRTERAVTEVIQHIPGAVQLDLFATTADEPPETPQEPEPPA